MHDFIENIQLIINKPIYSILTILNIILIEGILSIDNAAILASMISDFPKNEQDRALKYGFVGAYFFRVLCLIFATILIKINWLKLIGGLYLLFIGIKFFFIKKNELHPNKFKIYNNFWIKILYIEFIDLSFSIDNIIAASAISNNLLLIFLGIFLGILTMRYITKLFIKLIQNYPHIQNTAFLIITLLGLKMVLTYYVYPDTYLYWIIQKFLTDYIISTISIFIFIFPIFLRKIKVLIK